MDRLEPRRLLSSVTFTLDPTKSSLAFSGQVEGFAVSNQSGFVSSDSYSGTVTADVAPSAITFNSAHLTAASHGAAQPLGSSANYALQAQQFGFIVGQAAVRNMALNMTSGAFAIAQNGSFESGGALFTITSGKVDYTSTAQSGSASLVGLNHNDLHSAATLKNSNGLMTLMIPIDVVYHLSLIASNDTTVQLIGQIAATASGPQITSANKAKLMAGVPGTFTVAASHDSSGTLTETGLPGNIGLTFTDQGHGTAILSGTPAAEAGGTYILTLTADSGVGLPSIQTFTLTVDQAPAITTASPATFTTGLPGTFKIDTTGFPAAKVTESGALPGGVKLVGLTGGGATAELIGTPTAKAGGTYHIKLTASNGISPAATKTFTLTVDQSPTFTSMNHATFKQGVAGTFMVKTIGFPAAMLGETLTLNSGLAFVDGGNGTGTLTSSTSLAAGTYSLIFSAGNIAGSVNQSFSLVIK